MTVQQLREQLSEYPPGLEVYGSVRQAEEERLEVELMHRLGGDEERVCIAVYREG